MSSPRDCFLLPGRFLRTHHSKNLFLFDLIQNLLTINSLIFKSFVEINLGHLLTKQLPRVVKPVGPNKCLIKESKKIKKERKLVNENREFEKLWQIPRDVEIHVYRAICVPREHRQRPEALPSDWAQGLGQARGEN